MKTSGMRWMVVGTVLAGACVVDKQLGDPGADGEGMADSAAAASEGSGTTDGPGGTGPSGQSGSDTGPGNQTSMDGSDDNATAGSDETCQDWAAPPSDCEGPGEASAVVSGTNLEPELQDAACTVVSVVALDATTDTLTVDCGQPQSLDITTAAPHLALPVSVGQAVQISTQGEMGFTIDESALTFTIRSETGDLLLAWVNLVDFDLTFEVDVPLDPIAFTVGPSGCPGGNVAEECDGSGSILSQRAQVYLGDPDAPLTVFDGSHSDLVTDAGTFSVTVATANQVMCWDDDCAGDDSGPFDYLRLLVVAQ